MKKILIITILFIPTIALANDIICFDNKGYITEKYYSKDGNHPAASRTDCLTISREKFNSLTDDNKVDGNIIGTNDDKVIEKTDKEKQDDQKAIDDSIQVQEDFVNSIKGKLKAQGFTDEEIIFILNN